MTGETEKVKQSLYPLFHYNKLFIVASCPLTHENILAYLRNAL